MWWHHVGLFESPHPLLFFAGFLKMNDCQKCNGTGAYEDHLPMGIVDTIKCDCTQEPEAINHPSHYGGDTPYEAIKVIEAWELGFNLGNTVKYISRAGKKDPLADVADLKKAMWYLEREIKRRES